MYWGIILAGGEGSRFWPLSTPDLPKQLLPLTSTGSTALQALEHLSQIIPRERILLITSQSQSTAFRKQVDLPAENILAEPRPASTAPALAWATAEAARRDPDAVVISLHSDWVIPDPAPFQASLRTALSVADRLDFLVAVGLTPRRPDAGYGYILPGDPLDDTARTINEFVEKPSPDRAQALIDRGALWNSGLFAWRAKRFFTELGVCTPEVAGALAALHAGEIEQFYAEVTPMAIDHAVFERSRQTAVVQGEFAWDDVGTWDALFRVRSTDADGNIVVGDCHPFDTSNSLVWSDGPSVVTAGVDGLVIIAAHGRVLVIPRERAAALKDELAKLPESVRRFT